MKTAIILGRGIEGCGVTRSALELQNFLVKQNIDCDTFASIDKKWGRSKAQEHNIFDYKNNEIEDLKNHLNASYDIVFYQSLPSKSHSEEYRDLFYNVLVKQVTTVKIAFQFDHKAMSLSRNSLIWETMAEMNACFTHSLTSVFAEKMAKLNPSIKVLKMGLGFDFDILKHFWKPIDQQIKRISYFGRFAGFKEPWRIIEMQPMLKEKGIISELRGIERSIGSLSLFYNDTNDRDNTYKTNIYEVKKDDKIIQNTDKAYIYGPYNRLEGIEEISKSMFSADFYNLDKKMYGDNFEFSMCEMIACGSIPVFDQHWADNCHHLNGQLFADLSEFAIYSDRDNLQKTVDELNELALNNDLRDKRRNTCLEIAKTHADSSIVLQDVLDQALNLL